MSQQNNNNDNNNSSLYHTSEEVHFIPHFKTITEGGKSHFNRIADGLAEFVDNSMEAGIKGNIENTLISIDFFIDKGSKGLAGYCVIADNGIGMDKNGLKQFATFSLDQNTKKQESNDESLDNFISKYGVGAKEAGFYLGNRMRVVTKSIDKSGDTLTLCLDRDQFEKRYKDGLSAFTANIESRKGFDVQQLPQDEQKWSRLVELIQQHEANNQTFTYIVIKLELETVKNLFKNERYQLLPAEIAEIYHFHLHPEHRPSNIIETFNAKKLEGFEKSKGIRESTTNIGMKLDIYLTVHSKEGFLLDKQKLSDDNRNPIQRYIEKAQQAFRFNILVPPPANSLTLSQEEEQHKLTIEGILFYYPYDQGETRPETRPDQTYDKSGEGDKDNARPFSVFNTFWVNRLVPASDVKRLPFFPKFPKGSQYKLLQELKIPSDWMNRLKGFLFFDREFPITNNKLRIQVDPDIDTWLNDKKVETRDEISFAPRSLGEDFKKWLSACHKMLDREFAFSDRDYELQSKKGVDDKFHHCCKRLEVLGSTKLIIMKDDLVKLHIKVPFKQTPQIVIAKILTFQLDNEGDKVPYDPATALIRYRAVGDKERDYDKLTQYNWAPLSCLDIKGGDYKALQKDLDNLTKMSPKSLEVTLFDKKGDSGRTCEKKGAQKVHSGEPLFKIGVQVINGKGDAICQKPQNLTNHKYKLRLILDKDSTSPIEVGTTQDLWFYNPEKKEEEKKDFKKKDSEGSYYCFWDVTFNRSGKIALQFDLIDPDDKDSVVMSKTIDVIVAGKSVNGFTLEFTNPPKDLQFSDGIPEFQVVFRDKCQNVFNYVGKIMTKVTCQDMEIFCLGAKKNKLVTPQWQMEDDDEGKLSFIDNQWNIAPLKKMFADSLEVIEKDFMFELYELVASKVDNGKSDHRKLGEQQFKLRFCPGMPHSLELIDPLVSLLPVDIVNGESIDSLTIAVLDKDGNRTAPRGKNVWRLIAEGDNNCDVSAKDAPIINTGEGSFRDIKINAEEHITSEGLKSEIVVKLTGPKDLSVPPLRIPVMITASTYPSELRVFYQGSTLVDSTVFNCNSVISDLSFRLYDNMQQEIEFTPKVFSGSNSYLNLSWVNQEDTVGKKGRKSKAPSVTSNNLPDITIDSKIDSSILEFTIDAVVFDKSKLYSSFIIRVSPGPATGWKIITGPKFVDGIMSDDAPDLKSKVHCICMVDEFENIIGVDEALKPRLLVKSNDITDNVEANDQAPADKEIKLLYHSAPLEPSLSAPDRKNKNSVKLPNVNCFIIDKDECLQANPSPASVWLYVSDALAKLAPTSQRCIVTNGVPSVVKLSSETLNILRPEIQPSIPVSTFTQSLSMTLHFQDRSGNDGTMSGIKAGIELNVVLVGNDGEKDVMRVKSIKSIAHTINIPIADIMSKIDKDVNDFVLRFKCSYMVDKEPFTLEPAQLFCNIQKMNAVVDFKAFVAFNDSDLRLITGDTLEINCSKNLPSIALEAITDDGQAFIPSHDDLEITVNSVGHQNNANINHTLSFNDNLCIVTLTNSSIPLQIGTIKLTIKYEEKRPNIVAVNSTGVTELEKTITLSVVADLPSIIKLDSRSSGKLNNLFVSRQKLVIASNVQIVIGDQYDNPCSYPTSMEVKCRIVSQESDNNNNNNDDGLENIPKLQLAAADGYIVSKMDRARNTATFSKIELADADADAEFDEGNFNVEFSVIDNGSNGLQSRIPVLLFPFKLISNASIEAEVTNLMQKINPIEAEVRNYEETEKRYKSEISGITKDIDSLLKSAKVGRLKELSSDSINENVIQSTKNGLEQQQRGFADQSQIRPAVKRESPTAEQLRDIPIIGMVVDLGFVDDINNARILSWAAQSYMKAVVVENYDLSKKLYSRGVKSWPISGVVPFEIRSKDCPQGRTRNDNEKRSKRLFGPIEGNDIPGGIKGNPEYLAELISVNDESLRDTIFFNVFKRQLLFDDLDAAIKYREWMVKKKRNVPTIYTRTGEKLTQEGQLDPVGGKLPDNLSFIFGQTRAQHGNDYKYIEQDIETCKKILNSLANRYKINDDLNKLLSHYNDYESNKQALIMYQAELKALNSNNNNNNNNRNSSSSSGKRRRDNNELVDDSILLKRVATNNGDDDNNNSSNNRKRRFQA